MLEGIMMKNGDAYAVAVRTPDNQIVLKVDEYHMFSGKRKWAKLPVIRGVFNFVDSMILGMQTLAYSADFFEEEAEGESGKEKNGESSGKREQDRESRGGNGEAKESQGRNGQGKESPDIKERGGKTGNAKEEGGMGKAAMALTVTVSILLAVGIFMVLPVVLVSFLRRFTQSSALIALTEGVVRIGIFLAYVALISRMEDIKRVFMYHGAEHKCINCVEHGMELNVENVMKSSRLHKRCGTSFLLIVMLISVVFFMFVRVETLWLRILSRICFIPLIAGVSYEFIRLAGNSDGGFVDLLSKPGLCLQKLTTKEPDERMAQVAIAAVEAVFDWKKYLEENFKQDSPGLRNLESEKPGLKNSHQGICSQKNKNQEG